MRSISVLGSTGSIGTQALDVIARLPDRFHVHAIAGHRDVDAVAAQVARFAPSVVAMASTEAAARLADMLRRPVETDLSLVAADPAADVVLNAVVGAAGLRATLAAMDAGRIIALANKESCVAGGPLVASRLAAGTGSIVPVDSEHAATHMCLAGEAPGGVRRLVLTASGGPFRGRTDVDDAGVEEALAHPTWRMGPKITVDSATLMNKGLEVIEAHVLFGLGYDEVDVVCHPQSVVHCLVEFADGSWKASMSPPDMRVPIAYALGWPERPDWGSDRVDWTTMRDLTFEPVDTKTFRCVDLAYAAGRAGGTAPAVLNAANEVAVQAFLECRLRFGGIADTVEGVLNSHAPIPDPSLEDVLAADAWARARAAERIGA